MHFDVEVTDVREGKRRLVSQAFCSALPVAYGAAPRSAWEAFARLILEAAYEATLLAAVDRESNIVLLTREGGGAFGNADEWIDDAIVRALAIVEHAGLDIRLSVTAEFTIRIERLPTDSMDERPWWPHDALLHAWWVEPSRLLAGEYAYARWNFDP